MGKLGLCKNCWCTTKTIFSSIDCTHRCGKCGKDKELQNPMENDNCPCGIATCEGSVCELNPDIKGAK